MNESDTYREWAPPAAWRSTVACLWEQRVPVDLEHRVVPDGCADIIVTPSRAMAVGLADGVAVHRLAAGSWCRGLRLRPEAVTEVLGLPGDELRNAEVPLDDVVGSARARRLVDTVVSGRHDPVLAASPPPDVAAALSLLGERSVDEVAAMTGWSPRHLRRRILRATGLGPKTYQRVLRFRRFLEEAESGVPLAVAGASAGYADQAHLTREVRALSGLPPAALLASRASSSALRSTPQR